MLHLLTKAYDAFYFSPFRNALTLGKSVLIIIMSLLLSLVGGGLFSAHALFPAWLTGLFALICLLALLSLIPNMVGYRKCMVNLVPLGAGAWGLRMSLLHALRADGLARLEKNFLEIEVFIILRSAYNHHLLGSIRFASHLFIKKEKRVGHAEDIATYFIGWDAEEQENVSSISPFRAVLINRLIRARTQRDGKPRAEVKPGPVHGIIVHCKPHLTSHAPIDSGG